MTGSNSFGVALVAGRNLVPSPATGKIAVLILVLAMTVFCSSLQVLCECCIAASTLFKKGTLLPFQVKKMTEKCAKMIMCRKIQQTA